MTDGVLSYHSLDKHYALSLLILREVIVLVIQVLMSPTQSLSQPFGQFVWVSVINTDACHWWSKFMS